MDSKAGSKWKELVVIEIFVKLFLLNLSSQYGVAKRDFPHPIEKKKEPPKERCVLPLSTVQNVHMPCVRCVPGSGVMTIASAEIRTVVRISS